jgi:ABC-2 type transport system ATP-binding protein
MTEPTAPPLPVLHVQDLRYAYKQQIALRGVTFAVQPRSIHGFVGPNGAGKTTTLKIIATLLRPKGGTVRVFNHDLLNEYKTIREHIGFMPDHFSVYRQMTVHEYLDFFGAAYGLDFKRREHVIKDVLTLTDMQGRKNDLLKGLSRGMQQRVSLARVLVHDPNLLLLDEPASGLDPRARIELMEILKELRRMGKTIFISSHILAELGQICDSVTIIDRGVVRYTGGIHDLLISRSADACTYIISLASANDAVFNAMKSITGVLSAEKMEDRTAAYRVTVSPEKVGGNALIQTAIANGAEVTAFQQELRHLNEAFMDLTRPGVTS